MPALPPFLQRVRDLGYVVFHQGAWNLNFIGVRYDNGPGGTFNDWISCWYRADEQWCVRWWPATTDPGTYWLLNPMRVQGTAILVPAQYRGVWRIGTHKGYKAFQQVAPVLVYRDSNRDGQLDYDPDTVGPADIFGINGHAADGDPWDDLDVEKDPDDTVDRWSAGCQVWARSKDFREAITMAAISERRGFGSRFTYTLVTAQQMGLV